MNIRDLKYFHQLVKNKNFSQTADYFGVSQPAITLAIKRVETQFGSKLFVRDRSHHELQVTSGGYQLDQHIEQILTELMLAQKELKRTDSEKILFGLPPIIGTYYFPALTPQLLQQGLMDSLETFEAGSQDMLQLLQKGELDLALIGSLAPIANHQIKATLFKSAAFKIVVSSKNPLANQKQILFKQLKDQPFITLNEGFVHANAFKLMCEQNDFKPKIVYQTNDVHILKALVKENVGIAFLTDLAVPTTDGLTKLDLLDDQQPRFLISVAYRANYFLKPKQKKLVETLLRNSPPS
ncbi:LysR family transcriptional regulator [Liquorilactobacillus sicerae]|uniref:LysR family transcriptional regulator n=1 Tax=Liquorilactobacillus sicerae TaxID=1416943 RepID=UPI0024805ADC